MIVDKFMAAVELVTITLDSVEYVLIEEFNTGATITRIELELKERDDKAYIITTSATSLA